MELKDIYSELRGSEDFHYDKERRCYLAVTQTDVDRFLKSDDVTVEYLFRASRHVFGKTMLDSDSPQMLIIKREVAKFFNLKSVKNYEEKFIRTIINEIIYTLKENKEDVVNFHKDVAQRIPTKVILALYGIDESLDNVIYFHLDRLVKYIDDPNYPLSDALTSKEFLTDFLSKCLEGEIEIREDGMLNQIDKSIFEDKQELLNTLLMVLAAGMATTIAAFDSLLLKMYEEKERTMNLKLEKEIKGFVSELLMEDPPLHSTVRFVKSNFEYKGNSFKKYDNINVNLASANFEQICPVTGKKLSDKSTSYTFGKGKHACLGSHLAISELTIFVEQFLPVLDEFVVSHLPENLILTGSTIKTYSNVKLNRAV